MQFQQAVLACDDRGTINPTSGSNTYTLGGFASIQNEHASLLRSWQEVKRVLCGSSDVELKWSHFFQGYHQDPSSNPLLSNDPVEWRHQALWALEEIFRNSSAFPITTVVRKDEIGSSLQTETPKGKNVIDIEYVFTSTIGQFSLYLKENNISSGEIWFDNMGSVSEQQRFQDSMTEFMDSLSNNVGPKQNIEFVKRINPKIKFLDSASEGVIQLADYISGVIWAAAEGDSWFLSKVRENYAPGRKKTYGIVLLAA